MNCTYIQERLDEICSGQVKSDALEQAQNHIAECADCAALIEEHRVYLNIMQQFKAPELAPGLGAAMFRNARLTHSRPNVSNASGFLKGFAAASVLYICLASFWYFGRNNPTAPTTVQKYSAVSKDAALVISVPADMPNADISLILPEDVVLAGYEGLKKINWTVDLKQGANTLSLPIKVPDDRDVSEAFIFIAKINYKNKQKIFEIQAHLS